MRTLDALSSLDGRYRKSIETLARPMSEYGLIHARLEVMVEWVIHLASLEELPIRQPTEEEAKTLRLHANLSVADAEIVKLIETEGHGHHSRTNHDVKACELYLRDKLEGTELEYLVEWIHFGLTSEDVNNLAYATMLCKAVHDVLLPELNNIKATLTTFSIEYADLPMLARTHGQAASPTTLGKEFAVFRERLNFELDTLGEFTLSVKVNGASGNYSALDVAFPEINWEDVAYDFVQEFNLRGGGTSWYSFNATTTQIDPHDTYAELFQVFARINTILLGFSQDVWRYVSDDWISQKPAAGETGSSTMPHKVNPIDFENAEGNLGVANALFEYFARKLPVSRLQRDLSDSTVERNFGTALGHSLVAYKALLRGLGKIAPNEAKILADLDAHPEVITEAVQTVLRVAGFTNAYMAVKEMSRGKKLTLADIHAFVEKLDIPSDLKTRLLALTPRTYIGRAALIARQTT